MKRDFILNRIIKVMLLVLSMTVGKNAWAESTWEVQETSHNSSTHVTTFTITRSETGYAQTVLYRTVSLSAYAGQHYTATSGSISFDDDDDTKTVTVSELTPSGSYKYQDGTKNRKYRFEVTDRAGFRLDYADRTMTNGTSFSADKVSQSITNLVYFNSNGNYTSDVNSSKYVDVSYTPPTSQVETSGTLNGYVLIDDSYDYAQKPATVSTSDLINTTNADATYLNNIDYKIYATVCFTEKEKDDGYQYIQIVAGNSSASYDTGYDPNGSVNDPVNSAYKTCFELSDGSNAEGKQFFPHRYSYANKTAETNANIGITEFSQTNGKLWQHKFKSGYQATNSGSLIFNANTSYITTRFDAGGDNDDTWGYKDLFVRMALVDASAPTKSAVSVNPGRHSKGNTVYVSVAFNEIVTVTGTPTLTTTSINHWGSLSYVEGSGTNVLTFSTTIPQDATGSLNITGLSGTVKDLAGNSLTVSGVTASGLCSVDADLAYTLSDFQQEGGAYLISCRDDLRGLAGYVSGGNNCSGLTFRQVADIAFAHTTNWNNSSSTENNFTAIGDDDHPFQGTYDGDGHTISGIRIYKGGDKISDTHQGLFGMVGSGGTVKRVTLADARITGDDYTGGIAGATFSCTIEDCTVEADVCIHAVKSYTYYHGCIVGFNQADRVNRCISRARLTVANASYCKNFGGIVGFNTNGTITDCIAEGVVIPDVNGRGAIVGYKTAGTLSRNYYRGCTVAGVANATGVGQGTSESSTVTSDVSGAQSLYAVTMPEHVSLVRNGTNLPGTGNATYTTGADIDGQSYAYATATLRLRYDASSLPSGYDLPSIIVKYTSGSTVVDVTSNGDYTFDFTMPDADVTVTATFLPVFSYIDANGVKQSHMCTPITTSTRTYGNAANAEGWYCVNSDVNFTDIVHFYDQMVNIILCDGATMSGEKFLHESHSVIEVNNGSLAIYGQIHGTGTLSLNCTEKGSAISANTNIDINGGTVNATSRSGNGIKANNAIIIRRGNIKAKGSSDAAGISASTVTLGCPTTADRIYATGYNGTVTIADGQTLTDGISANTYTNTLTDEQKAAVAGKTMMKALGNVSYIDENGQEQICSSYQILSDGVVKINSTGYIGTAGQDTWYVASRNYTINATYLETRGHVHIILCDGANFTVNGSGSYGINAKNDLSIYGQSQDTGTLTANVAGASGKALYVNSGNLVLNGGVVNANGGEYGIYISIGNQTVNGGTINASGTTSDIHATGGGATVILCDGIGSFTVTSINAGTVQFKRTFSAGKASTICLPFAMTSISGGKVYEFQDVTYDAQDGWVATMVDATPGPGNEVTSTNANTPYLFMPDSDDEVTFSGTASASVTEGTTNSGDWTFHGTYSYLDYGDDPFSGTVFGFAATSGKATDGVTDVEAGQFVKAASGAFISPFRAFLTYAGSDAALHAPSRDGAVASAPDRIKVRLLGTGGDVTAVGTIDVESGDITIEKWFDMNGRSVDGMPTQPGIYLNNKGSKVMIK